MVFVVLLVQSVRFQAIQRSLSLQVRFFFFYSRSLAMVLLPLILFLLSTSSASQPFQVVEVPVNSKWTIDPSINPQPAIIQASNYSFGFTKTCAPPSLPPSFYLSIWKPDFKDVNCSCSTTVTSLWQASRDFPVSANATLAFGDDGNLVLSQGSLQVWSSNTSGQGVVAMVLYVTGNLVLHREKFEIVWQSFDHPTDSLLVNQVLKLGTRIVSSASPTNKSPGSFYLELQPHALVGFAQAPGTPQTYMIWDLGSHEVASLVLEGCTLFAYSKLDAPLRFKSLSSAPFCFPGSFLKLQHDGEVRFWQSFRRRDSIVVGSRMSIGECGKYGVILQKTCACLDFDPSTLKLKPVTNGKNPCSVPEEVSSMEDRCNGSAAVPHQFVEARGYDYLPLHFMQGTSNLSATDCQKSCLSDCTCVAAFFHQFATQEQASACYRVSALYTVAIEPLRHGYASVMFLKIKSSRTLTLPPVIQRGSSSSRKALRVVANTAIGAFSAITAASLLIALLIARWRRRMARIWAVEDLET
ncbi:EP1-like glycoprotein 2 [Selaginella moellendorffii]|nr:EP1-like glycoprotein 2 [Selaginella moellendorffii]|eukprot:XP_024529665.1 EP1-like glycoprotein 2 [Selaginella moellendorffii]